VGALLVSYQLGTGLNNQIYRFKFKFDLTESGHRPECKTTGDEELVEKIEEMRFF
jgi:hypothetical protein